MNGLEIRRTDRVVTVELNGDRRNALGRARYAGLVEAARSVGVGEILHLRARGPHFCAGQDLAEFAEDQARGASAEGLELGAAAILAVLRCRGVVLVEAQGAAVGGGALLVAAADVAVLSDDAWLALPELQLGLALGASVAERLLPAALVRRMMLLGERAPATQLAALGVASVVAAAELVPEAARALEAMVGLDSAVVAEARAAWGGGEREVAATRYEAEVASCLRRFGVQA
ncbi:enoyl-CoA hydratase/isomerase family protein [Nocardioides sp. Bht2]|uniref:enoyl-CoA hydratase/isomerase family protein n=1 Tax=Nocardioides sp. Bht2 TaxID=3392297 RepID=UPI0039B4FF21